MAQQSALPDVLTAVYTALNVTSMTTLLSASGVRNDAPAKPSFPYVRIESPTEQLWDTFGRDGKELLVWVHVFSQAPGDLEALNIVSKAIELIHQVELPVAGHTLGFAQLDQHFPGGDEMIQGVRTVHRIAQFRIRVHQT